MGGRGWLDGVEGGGGNFEKRWRFPLSNQRRVVCRRGEKRRGFEKNFRGRSRSFHNDMILMVEQAFCAE